MVLYLDVLIRCTIYACYLRISGKDIIDEESCY